MKVIMKNASVIFKKEAPFVVSLTVDNMTAGSYLNSVATGLTEYSSGVQSNMNSGFVSLNGATKLVLNVFIASVSTRQYSAMMGFYSGNDFGTLVKKVAFEDVSTDEEALTWKEITYEVPEGAKYFLISQSNLSLISDFNSKFTVKGYNI